MKVLRGKEGGREGGGEGGRGGGREGRMLLVMNKKVTIMTYAMRR